MGLGDIKTQRSGGKGGSRHDRRAYVKWVAKHKRRIEDKKAERADALG